MRVSQVPTFPLRFSDNRVGLSRPNLTYDSWQPYSLGCSHLWTTSTFSADYSLSLSYPSMKKKFFSVPIPHVDIQASPCHDIKFLKGIRKKLTFHWQFGRDKRQRSIVTGNISHINLKLCVINFLEEHFPKEFTSMLIESHKWKFPRT